MTPKQLGTVWTAVSLFLVYYVLNTWLVSQGGVETFGTNLIVQGRMRAIVTAIPICGILLLTTSLIGRLHAVRYGAKWHERVPVVGFDDINTGSPEGRTYQAGMLFAFAILPWLGLMHFSREALNAEIVTNDVAPSVVSMWDWSALLKPSNPAFICDELLTKGLKSVCTNPSTFYPGLQPTMMLVLLLAALAASVAHWKAILRPVSAPAQSVE